MPEPESADRAAIRGWVRQGLTRIEPGQAGLRLDRYLARRFTYRSRTQWRRLIHEGRITIDGHKAKPSLVLRAGHVIRYVPRRREEPRVDPSYKILHVDPALVAVSKSGNLPLHPSGRYFRHTLLHLLLADHPEWGRLHVIHRLDRETSGVVIFGRNRADTDFIARQFRGRRVRKQYLAAVDGQPPADEFTIDLPLGQTRDGMVRKAVAVREDGAPARTQVRVLYRGENWAWLDVRPQTGRLHQIRVHLQSAGLPVVGDKVYGRAQTFFLKFVNDVPLSAEEQAILGLPRQALHAYSLEFIHPQTGEPLTLTADLPDDMAALLRSRGLDPSPWRRGEP